MARSRKAALYERHLADVLHLASLLTSGPDAARVATDRAFARCFGRLEHLRDPADFEISLLRELIRSTRSELPGASKKAAGFLVHRLGMSTGAVAFVMQQSPASVRQLAEDASADASQDLAIPQPAGAESFDAASRRVSRRGLLQTAGAVAVAIVVTAAAVVLPSALEPGPRAGDASRSAGDGLDELLPGSYVPTGPKVPVAGGRVGSKEWRVNAYRAEMRHVCLEIRVERSYGAVHCLKTFRDAVRAYVAPDKADGTTFLYGYTGPKVAQLTVTQKGGTPIEVDLIPAPGGLGAAGPSKLFVITLPDYLLPLASKKEGKSVGYQTFHLKLLATATHKPRRSGHQDLFLGRPTP
jgi:hypothetical protein